MQSASHDCGFHKLMHAQHWGRAFSVQLQEKDICNIRKILTHMWLNFEENDSGKASRIWHRYDSFTARPSLANQYSALGISSIFKKIFSIFQEAFFSDQNSILYQNLCQIQDAHLSKTLDILIVCQLILVRLVSQSI